MKMKFTKEFDIRFEVINHEYGEGGCSEDTLKSVTTLEEAIDYRETYLSNPLNSHKNIEIRVEYIVNLIERK
jgi:hypothetical protein